MYFTNSNFAYTFIADHLSPVLDSTYNDSTSLYIFPNCYKIAGETIVHNASIEKKTRTSSIPGFSDFLKGGFSQSSVFLMTNGKFLNKNNFVFSRTNLLLTFFEDFHMHISIGQFLITVGYTVQKIYRKSYRLLEHYFQFLLNVLQLGVDILVSAKLIVFLKKSL